MCEPVSAIVAGASMVGSGVMGAVAQDEASARSKNAAQANADALSQAYDENIKSMMLRAKQLGKETAREETELSRRLSTLEGMITTSAAYGGVSGASVQKMTQVANAQIMESQVTLAQNTNAQLQQLRAEMVSERARTMTAINQQQANVSAPSSPLGTILGITGNLASLSSSSGSGEK